MTFDTHSDFFTYKDKQLHAEAVPIADIVREYGTPTYVYSRQAILEPFDGYQHGLNGLPHIISFAVKSNGNVALMRLLAEKGAGADLTSGGELFLALQAGIPADKIVFSGVGKTAAEIRYGLEAGILMFNIESEPELETIAAIAKEMGKTAPVAVRVNPNVDAKTHPKITTGLRENKFGVPWEQCEELYLKAAEMENIEVRGIAAHIGSSLKDTKPLLDSLDRLMNLRQRLEEKGLSLPYVDIGGGLGIRYEQEAPKPAREYAEELKAKVENSGATLILEPGRSILGNAALLITEVQYVKRNPDRTFLVVDAAMNDLARPAIYGAFHEIVPVQEKPVSNEPVDVVGPICETSDTFGKERRLPECGRGDLLGICSAGAYGFAMASFYNGRVRCAEVLVEGDQHRLIRKRETMEDLLRNQVGA